MRECAQRIGNLLKKKRRKERKKRRKTGRRIDSRTNPYVERNVTKSTPLGWRTDAQVTRSTVAKIERSWVAKMPDQRLEGQCKRRKTFAALSSVVFSSFFNTYFVQIGCALVGLPLAENTNRATLFLRETLFRGYIARKGVSDKRATENDVRVSRLKTRSG